jgi:hypothetical protein
MRLVLYNVSNSILYLILLLVLLIIVAVVLNETELGFVSLLLLIPAYLLFERIWGKRKIHRVVWISVSWL